MKAIRFAAAVAACAVVFAPAAVSASKTPPPPTAMSGDFEYDIMSVDDALASPVAKQKLDGTVKFFFSGAPRPAVALSLGEVAFKEKAGFMKSNVTACNEAFATVLEDYQTRAKAVGADAVVNLRGYFKKQEVAIDKTFPCYPGGFRVGVVLKGEIVKLGEPQEAAAVEPPATPAEPPAPSAQSTPSAAQSAAAPSADPPAKN